MRNILFIFCLLVSFSVSMQAQDKTKSSAQTRKIEINNDKGKLFLSFEDGQITKFVVNNKPVPEEQYDNYQEILDAFSEDEPQPPSPPTPPVENQEEDLGKKLRSSLVDKLLREGIISSSKKYNIQLKRKLLKVDGEKMHTSIHQACLDLFEEIYGQELNDASEIALKKSKSNSSSTISVVN